MTVINNQAPIDVPAQNTQIVHVMEKPITTPEQVANKFSSDGFKITIPKEFNTSKTAKENDDIKNLVNLGGRAESVERNRKAKEIKNQNDASHATKTTTNKGIEAARQKAAAGKTSEAGKSDNQGIKSFQSKTSGQTTSSSKNGSSEGKTTGNRQGQGR